MLHSAERKRAPKTTITQPEVEYWLGNIALLLGDDGLPRHLSEKSQTPRILASGDTWTDTSGQRYVVGRGLVMYGYSDAKIARCSFTFATTAKAIKRAAIGSRPTFEEADGAKASLRSYAPNCRTSSRPMATNGAPTFSHRHDSYLIWKGTIDHAQTEQVANYPQSGTPAVSSQPTGVAILGAIKNQEVAHCSVSGSAALMRTVHSRCWR
jgi:hypothetical protein